MRTVVHEYKLMRIIFLNANVAGITILQLYTVGHKTCQSTFDCDSG